ncbi:hypothetical protein AMECASPLE_031124, partial [Ameca splendens]
YGCPSDRRSIATCVPPQTITAQSLQGKTFVVFCIQFKSLFYQWLHTAEAKPIQELDGDSQGVDCS